MKIVILDGKIANPGDLSWDAIGAFGELVVYEDTPKELVVKRLEDADIVIDNKVPIGREDIAALPKLKLIALLSTGYNVIDIEAAKERGIPVSNVPGYSTAAVAQSTIALLLEICNQVGHHSAQVHEGMWGKTKNWSFWSKDLMELQGKTMGIIGFGSIGQATGAIARALGMQVLATGSRPTPQGEAIGTYVDLDTLLARSDVVSLHCPLLPQTKGIICKKNIEKMRDGAILLNTARGPLLVDDDVAQALHAGKLRGLGMDVASKEPIEDDNPLLAAPGCFITPHIAWAAKETRARLLGMVADNIQAFLNGVPQNVVNS